jgi:hypothetical protein
VVASAKRSLCASAARLISAPFCASCTSGRERPGPPAAPEWDGAEVAIAIAVAIALDAGGSHPEEGREQVCQISHAAVSPKALGCIPCIWPTLSLLRACLDVRLGPQAFLSSRELSQRASVKMGRVF